MGDFNATNHGKIILVTGGAGYIGSHLCEDLVKNNNVISLDNYSLGSEKNHVKGVTYIEGSTADIHDLIQVSPDIIFHLGEYPRVEQSFEDIEQVWLSNIFGTFQMIQFAKKNNAKFVYAASSTKFSSDGKGKDLSPYSFTKYYNTDLIKNYAKWYGLDFAIVYFYNVYGGREITKGKYATLMAIFKDKYLHKEHLTVVLPGTQRRNFTYIHDIINGLKLVGEKGSGDGYAIGHPASYSVIEIAKTFGNKIIYLPERKGNRMNSTIDTQKTESLGWSPTTDLKDYIEQIINSQS